MSSAETDKMPSLDPLPSSIDRDAAAVIAAMDRHTDAMVRIAAALESQASALNNLAAHAMHFNEQSFHAVR